MSQWPVTTCGPQLQSLDMAEPRDTARLVADTPTAKRSLSYTETDDHQFSREVNSHKLYRAGLSSGCCHFEDTHALRMIVAWMATVAVVVFVALVVEIITREEVVGTGDVVTDHPNCSLIALATLREGGNAVDAAVAAGLCLAVTVPDRAGLGGGGVMLVHQLRTNSSTIIDFQDVSPSGLPIQNYQSNFKISAAGRDSVGVPGLVAGLHHAHQQYGSQAVKVSCCSWNDLVRKTLPLLSLGFSPESWWDDIPLEKMGPQIKKFITERGYSNPNSENTVKMRETFGSLLDHDPVKSFYSGAVARRFQADTEGHLTRADMANYTVLERKALRVSVGDYDVITSPTPTSGPELIAVLNAIQRIIGNDSIQAFDTDNYVEKMRNVLENVHRQQRLLGDPVSDSVHQNDENYKPTGDRMENLISKENVAKWMSERSRRQAQLEGRGERLPAATVVTVMDQKDVYVSMILSLNSLFGSRMFSDGILLNNALNAFEAPVEGPSETSSNELYEGLRSLTRSAPVVAVNTAGACRTRIVTGGSLAEQVAQVLGPVLIGDYGDYKRILDESRLLVVDDSVQVQEKKSDDFLSKQDIPKKSAIYWSKINLLEKNQDTISGHSEAGGETWATLRS